MRVKVTQNIVPANQVRQLALDGCLDLAPILAQFRRNPAKTKGIVHLGFLRAGNQGAILLLEAVLAQAQVLAAGDLAHADVVSLAAGKVLERRTPMFGLQHTQVHLQTVVQPDRGLGLSAQQHLGNRGQLRKGAHHRFGRRR